MPAAGLGQAAGSLARVYRGMIQISFVYSQMQGRERLPGWVGPGEVVAALSQSTRTLALLTRIRGAKRGANNRRSRAASGYIQPLPGRPNGTSGDTWHHPATLRKCLLSSRSRVRVAVGAQVRACWLPATLGADERP
jgi:hypothetical protein